MSNVSGVSTGSSSFRQRERNMGVPKGCWCGSKIAELISKSDNNPYRRYYHCGFAAAQKLKNDKHIFKWVDEAFLNEIETLQSRNARLEEEHKATRTTIIMDFENRVFEKVEKEVFQRVEDVLAESAHTTKKMMIFVVIGVLVIVGLGKLLG